MGRRAWIWCHTGEILPGSNIPTRQSALTRSPSIGHPPALASGMGVTELGPLRSQDRKPGWVVPRECGECRSLRKLSSCYSETYRPTLVPSRPPDGTRVCVGGRGSPLRAVVHLGVLRQVVAPNHGLEGVLALRSLDPTARPGTTPLWTPNLKNWCP